MSMTESSLFSMASLNPRRSAASSLFTVCRAAPSASLAFAYSSTRVSVMSIARAPAPKNFSRCAHNCRTRSFERRPSMSYCVSCSHLKPPVKVIEPSAPFVYSARMTRSGRPIILPLFRSPSRRRGLPDELEVRRDRFRSDREDRDLRRRGGSGSPPARPAALKADEGQLKAEPRGKGKYRHRAESHQ